MESSKVNRWDSKPPPGQVLNPPEKRRRWDVAPAVPVAEKPPTVPQLPEKPVEAPIAANTAASEPLPPAETGPADTIAKLRDRAAAVAAKLSTPGISAAPDRNPPTKVSIGNKVVINGASHTLRRQIIHHIGDFARQYGVVIRQKGRYHPPMGPPITSQEDADQPLYLHITPWHGDGPPADEATQRRTCQIAADAVNAILEGKPGAHFPQPGAVPAVQLAPPPPPPRPPAVANPQCRFVFFGVAPPAEFNVAARLAGPGGSYLEHIRSTTGVTCHLVGPEAGTPQHPLHIYLGSEDPGKLAQAEQ